MRIGIYGWGKPVFQILPVLINSGIEIVYVKPDIAIVEEEDLSIIKSHNIPLFSMNVETDIIFVVNYNKIISNDILSNKLVVNYHVGLLPKWRGNSANGWAIINGENQTGYTIHRVVEELDGGPIYYQFSFPYKEGQTYFEAKEAMTEDFLNTIPQLLYKIFKEPTSYITSPCASFSYCCRFRPIDGIISWSKMTTDEIMRRHYVFGRPMGTGLKFYVRGEEYEISRLSRIDNICSYMMTPGAVIYKCNGSAWIKTKDSAISIDEVCKNGDIISIDSLLKIGQRL